MSLKLIERWNRYISSSQTQEIEKRLSLPNFSLQAVLTFVSHTKIWRSNPRQPAFKLKIVKNLGTNTGKWKSLSIYAINCQKLDKSHPCLKNFPKIVQKKKRKATP